MAAHQALTIAENGAPAKLIDVDILGHIFEQSITGLDREQERAGFGLVTL